MKLVISPEQWKAIKETKAFLDMAREAENLPQHEQSIPSEDKKD